MDKYGRKMGKSLNNTVEPHDVRLGYLNTILTHKTKSFFLLLP